ncbi:MAG: DNA-protecting protein DprA [Deltaproteobacteria bacterium]|nr:MAG: DNA-protecting protein DprA [Deltaproteobacteria bacterium]
MALAHLAGEGRGGPWWRAAKELGGAPALLAAGEERLRAAGLSERGARSLARFSDWRRIEAQRDRCRRLGISIFPISHPQYPRLLREIADPPLVLYARGDLSVCRATVVAVVGTRRPTRYGLRTASLLGRELSAAGVVVASGLARGIDAAVHHALVPGGRGVAVLAGGLDRVSPRSNRRLAARLLEGGALLSEHPPGTAPLPGRFPVRNRIITGLAAATVVVEAAERSGSLVSARHAVEQGREVLAVPGNIDSPASQGTNRLIRDGCAPMLEIADVLAACNIPACAQTAAPAAATTVHATGEAARVAAELDREGRSVDALIEATGISGGRMLELLTELEIGGVAERLPGGLFALKDGVRLG